MHKLPAKRLQLADGTSALVTTVYDLTMANYGLERGLNDANCATSYDDIKAYTPAWAEQITGVPRAHIVRIAREFADNADKTHGRSMIIVGAGLNHWYHLDMNYRGLINMLVFCGCIGQSGGGWAHYVGQKTASADRLAAAGLCTRLAASCAPYEQYLLFLQSLQPVALRDGHRAGIAVAVGGQIPL